MKYLDTKIATRKKVGVLILILLSTSFERIVQNHDALQSSNLAKIFENIDNSNVKASCPCLTDHPKYEQNQFQEGRSLH